MTPTTERKPFLQRVTDEEASVWRKAWEMKLQGLDGDTIRVEAIAHWQRTEQEADIEDIEEIILGVINAPFSEAPQTTSSTKEERTCKTITGTSLLRKHFEALKEVIRGLRPVGLGILAGKPKGGKSWIELGLAWAVSAGLLALGHFETDGGDVLYIALEDSPRRIQSRLRIVIGSDFAENDRLHIDFEWRRLDKGGLEDIEAWLSAHPNARMVIIDTFAKIKPSKRKDTDQYTADYEATGALQKIALKHSVYIGLVMHQRKAQSDDIFDSISGTLGLTGAADVIAILARDRSQKNMGRLHLTGRDIPEKTLELSFSDGLWSFTREVDRDECSSSIKAAEEFLLDVLARGPLPSDEIMQQGKQCGINRDTLFDAKKSLGVRARKTSFSGHWEWRLPDV